MSAQRLWLSERPNVLAEVELVAAGAVLSFVRFADGKTGRYPNTSLFATKGLAKASLLKQVTVARDKLASRLEFTNKELNETRAL